MDQIQEYVMNGGDVYQITSIEYIHDQNKTAVIKTIRGRRIYTDGENYYDGYPLEKDNMIKLTLLEHNYLATRVLRYIMTLEISLERHKKLYSKIKND